jgi:putative sigma-54 modulation protein
LKIDISGRHLLVTRAMKDYAREKMERLGRFYDRIRRVQVVMDVQGERQQVEMVVSLARGSHIIAHARDSSMYAAIDFVVDKCERQLTKLKEKLRGHKGRMSMGGVVDFGTTDRSDDSMDVEVDLSPEADDSLPAVSESSPASPSRDRRPAPARRPKAVRAPRRGAAKRKGGK